MYGISRGIDQREAGHRRRGSSQTSQPRIRMHFPEVLHNRSSRNMVLGGILERLEITFMSDTSFPPPIVAAGLLLGCGVRREGARPKGDGEAAGGGEIVMTSSIASMTANGSSIAYCASKAGMNSLTRTLAKTLGKMKIRVNAVLPGLIDGDWAFSTWGGGDAEQYEGLKKMFSDQTPLGHVVTPEDVADTILSLITGSDYVTGQLVTLDSGFTL